MAEAFPTAKRRVNGLGVDTGKRRKTSAFEDDGDEEEDEAPDRKKSKHDDDTDLGNIGFQQSEKRVMTEAINSGEDGIKKYGDTTGKWENDDDDKLEAFNLKEEMDNGYFDDEGVYVRNKEEKADPRDAWLDDFQERHNGKFAEEKQEEPDEEPERPMNSTEKIERQKELCSILTRGENVAMALKRLRKEKETFGRLTDLASELLSAGFFNIFQTPKEDVRAVLLAL
jgi:hypothetical protein